MYQQAKSTGIPYFIKGLFEKLLIIDKNNAYIFFQTNGNKKIGKTMLINLKDKGIYNAIFDFFLTDYLISRKIDISIFHGTSNMLPFFKRKNIKYIVTIHDLAFLKFKDNFRSSVNFYFKYAIGKSLKNADIIIADSKNTAKDIIDLYSIDINKIHVIYLGVNEIFLCANKKERLIKGSYFLSLTTHPKRKNILSVLEALSRDNDFQSLKYVIAGFINETQLLELKAKIQELNLSDKVILFGYATEMELLSLYQNAEFFIYPSFYEGFGLPVIEAMACKCPVIASNNSSLIEIVPNKEWLIDPYNIQEISDKMRKILDLSQRERDDLIESNYNFAKEVTWDKTARDYLHIYKSICQI
jgi:hypothetical protein